MPRNQAAAPKEEPTEIPDEEARKLLSDLGPDWEAKRPYPIPEGLVLSAFISCVPWWGPDKDVEEGFVELGSPRAQNVTAELDEDFTLTVTSTTTSGEQRVQVFPKGLTSVVFAPPKPPPRQKRDEP